MREKCLRKASYCGLQCVVDKEALGPPQPFKIVDEAAQQSLQYRAWSSAAFQQSGCEESQGVHFSGHKKE